MYQRFVGKKTDERQYVYLLEQGEIMRSHVDGMMAVIVFQDDNPPLNRHSPLHCLRKK